uniref:RING-type domain-containing protein n=1 Tax=viral metagenome TaxID=1070528 RepID=A0A6C0H5G9_9ZZZZ
MSDTNTQLFQLCEFQKDMIKQYDSRMKEYNDNIRLLVVQNGIIISEIIRNNSTTQNIFHTFVSSLSQSQNSGMQQHNGLRERDIDNLVRRCRFNTLRNPINNQCPITLATFQPEDEVIELNRCKHIFSRDAIYESLQRDSRCPYCRTDIRVQEEITIELSSIPLS